MKAITEISLPLSYSFIRENPVSSIIPHVCFFLHFLARRTEKETQMYRTDFWTLWEKARVGWSERIASKHVYYQVWNRSPAQVGCMRQVLRAGALGRPRGTGWGWRWEQGSGWGAHVNLWVIHVNVWQKPLKYCKVIAKSLQSCPTLWDPIPGTLQARTLEWVAISFSNE